MSQNNSMCLVNVILSDVLLPSFVLLYFFFFEGICITLLVKLTLQGLENRTVKNRLPVTFRKLLAFFITSQLSSFNLINYWG